jgi:hypothetical protein
MLKFLLPELSTEESCISLNKVGVFQFSSFEIYCEPSFSMNLMSAIGSSSQYKSVVAD